jgi:hypothetical protein
MTISGILLEKCASSRFPQRGGTIESFTQTCLGILSELWLLHDDRDFISRLQLWATARGHHNVSPFAGGRKSADLMRLINEFVQIQSEFFEGHWNDDFDIDPVIISSFFLDGGRYCEGSIHNLHRDLPKRRRRILGLVVESAFGVNRVSALPNEYQSEFGSTLCLKTEIFSMPFRSKIYCHFPGDMVPRGVSRPRK